jgi:hypothetical protein
MTSVTSLVLFAINSHGIENDRRIILRTDNSGFFLLSEFRRKFVKKEWTKIRQVK